MTLEINKILAILFFLLFMTVGVVISSGKYLWNDEVYSQTTAVSNYTYPQMIFSGIQGEGNRSPLFYLQQKVLCDIFHYQFHGERPHQAFDRVFLRSPTVLEISLFLSLLFYFFTRRFNLWFGFLGLFVALSSPMLWWYWAEARPYGLWVFLTGCQMLLFIDLIENSTASRKQWILLGLTHTLLALTCFLSVIQITIIAAILILKERHWEKVIFLFLIPFVLAFYYKVIGPVNNVIFTMTVDQILRDNIARDRLYIFLIYPFLLFLYSIRTKLHFKMDNLVVKSFAFFLASFSMVLLTVLLLAYLREHAVQQGQYWVVSRHIIFLLPVGIITVTYLTAILWESLKNINWLRVLLIAGVLILLIYRIERSIMSIKGFFLGLHA